MEIILAVVVIGGVVLFFLAGDVAASGTQTAFAAYFRGWKPDPWPHGVQEEYIERPWGSRPPEDAAPAANFEGRRDAEPPKAEIVDFFPTAHAQTLNGQPAAAAGATSAIAGSAAGSAGRPHALATQRVHSHRLRSRL